MALDKIGRFEVVRELGRGAQGAVYLANDPQLERKVAIKTLRGGAGRKTEKLLHEARFVSKLQHANIVPLYDAGEEDGAPYLVYAFVEGGTLEKMLADGELHSVKSAEIACSILDALEYAHQQGVIHLDIKPANIMLGQHGIPMLMDFGIARLIQDDGGTQGEVAGTPRYMAPESVSNGSVDKRSDLYSLGMVMYEMVAGRPAFDGENVFQIINSVAHDDVIPPSTYNPAIDAKLEEIILKAVSKDSDRRYPDAEAMREALKRFLGDQELVSGSKHSTLDFLLRRMRSKGDFPALSSMITEINTIVSSETESASKLARVILKDFALTNKLLRLVNTVSYGQFGGNINTISKAVMIMGFETVRNIAMSLIMLEFLQNKALASQLKEEVVGSFLAGAVAMQLAEERDFRDAEELMICAMFHNLGRMLVTFYFFEESQEIGRLIEQGADEESAAVKVLGLTFNELGVGVAKVWNFPRRLLTGMERLPQGGVVRKPRDSEEQLKVASNIANDLCVIAVTTAPQDKSKMLSKLCQRYLPAVALSERKLNEVIESGLQELSSRALTLEINMTRSGLVKKARQWSGHAVEDVEKVDPKDKGLGGVHGIEAALEAGTQEPPNDKLDPEAMLGAGIQDVTNTLVEDFRLNDLLLMVLETIYRGLGFKRALICIRDTKQGAMVARIGLGEDVNAVIPYFRFGLAFKPDVFHLAVDKGVDIVIEDVEADTIADKIPAWYSGLVEAKSFILLPVVINKKTVGLIYADMAHANSLKISEKQLSLLRTLRNQAVLAIKQKL